MLNSGPCFEKVRDDRQDGSRMAIWGFLFPKLAVPFWGSLL